MAETPNKDLVDQLDQDMNALVGQSVLFLKNTPPSVISQALESGQLSQEFYAQMNRWASAIDNSIPASITDAGERNKYVAEALEKMTNGAEMPNLEGLVAQGLDVREQAFNLSNQPMKAELADRVSNVASQTTKLKLENEGDTLAEAIAKATPEELAAGHAATMPGNEYQQQFQKLGDNPYQNVTVNANMDYTIEEAAPEASENTYMDAVNAEKDAETSATSTVVLDPKELERERAELENSIVDGSTPSTMFEGLAQKYADQLPEHLHGLISEIKPYQHSVTIKLHDGSQIRDLRSEIKLDTDPTEDSVAVLMGVIKARGMTSVNLNGDLQFKTMMYDALISEGIEVSNWSPDMEALEAAQKRAQELGQPIPQSLDDLEPMFANDQEQQQYADDIDPAKKQALNSEDKLAGFDAAQDAHEAGEPLLTEEELDALQDVSADDSPILNINDLNDIDYDSDDFEAAQLKSQGLTDAFHSRMSEELNNPDSELQSHLSGEDLHKVHGLYMRETVMAAKAAEAEEVGDEESASRRWSKSSEAAQELRDTLRAQLPEGAVLHQLIDAEAVSQENVAEMFEEITANHENLEAVNMKIGEAQMEFQTSRIALQDRIALELDNSSSDLHSMLPAARVQQFATYYGQEAAAEEKLIEGGETLSAQEKGQLMASQAIASHNIHKFIKEELDPSKSASFKELHKLAQSETNWSTKLNTAFVERANLTKEEKPVQAPTQLDAPLTEKELDKLALKADPVDSSVAEFLKQEERQKPTQHRRPSPTNGLG